MTEVYKGNAQSCLLNGMDTLYASGYLKRDRTLEHILNDLTMGFRLEVTLLGDQWVRMTSTGDAAFLLEHEDDEDEFEYDFMTVIEGDNYLLAATETERIWRAKMESLKERQGQLDLGV